MIKLVINLGILFIALFGFLNRWKDSMATQMEDVPAVCAADTLDKHGWEIGKHQP